MGMGMGYRKLDWFVCLMLVLVLVLVSVMVLFCCFHHGQLLLQLLPSPLLIEKRLMLALTVMVISMSMPMPAYVDTNANVIKMPMTKVPCIPIPVRNMGDTPRSHMS